MEVIYCDTCSEEIKGCCYATMGGNIVPYVAPKTYHIRCIPPLVAELKTIEESLDDIVRSILPVANAGWTRKQDAGDFKIYELAVPKTHHQNAEDNCNCSSSLEARRCTKSPVLGAPYDLSEPSLTWEKILTHTEYQVAYRADGNYHIPDHVGDLVRIVRIDS